MKKFISLICLLLAVFMLVSCTAAPAADADVPADKADTAEKGDESATADDGGKVELEFWINGTELTDAEGKDNMWYAIAKRYMEQNENVVIDVVPLSADYSDLGTKIAFAIQSDTVPDILLSNEEYARQFVESGSVATLDEYYAQDPEMKERFSPIAWDGINKAVGNSDHYYTLPIQNEAQGWLYNTAILNQYGLEVPETWDEFLYVIDTLNANDVTPIAFGYTDAWPLWGYWAMFNRYGIDDDFGPINDGTKKYTESEALKSVLARQRELFEHNAFAEDVITCDNTRALNTFITGGAAMYCASTTDVIAYVESSDYANDIVFNWGPTFSDSTYDQEVGLKVYGWQLYVGGNTADDKAKMDAIWDFFKFVSSEETSNFMIDEYGHIPATNYDFSEGKSKFMGQMLATLNDDWGAAYQYTRAFDPTLTMQNCYMQSNVLVGIQTPEEALAELQAAADQIQ